MKRDKYVFNRGEKASFLKKIDIKFLFLARIEYWWAFGNACNSNTLDHNSGADFSLYTQVECFT